MFTIDISDFIGRLIAIIVLIGATAMTSVLFVRFIKDLIDDIKNGLLKEDPDTLFPITFIACILTILVCISVTGLLYSVGILNPK